MKTAFYCSSKWIKLIALAIIFLASLAILIQSDIPTIQEIEQYVKTSFIQSQLELRKPNKEDHVQQGWIYYNFGQLEKARVVMEKAWQSDKDISALYCLGLIDIRYRHYDDGIAKLEKVAVFSPQHTLTLIALGKTYYQQRYYGKARDVLVRTIEIEPTNEEARLWLGKAYLKLNQNQKAVDMLETVTNGQESVEAAALIKTERLP